MDTYDTLEGVKNAIEVGKMLKDYKEEFVGIRIDSGDLAYFSQKARKLLDDAGFKNTKIIASNDLDENIITSLKQQDSAIKAWGIGTKLVTAFDQPALGAVYKLAALKNTKDQWEYKLKLSEQAIKVNNPGIQQVRRFFNQNKYQADMIYDSQHPLGNKHTFSFVGVAEISSELIENPNVNSRIDMKTAVYFFISLF